MDRILEYLKRPLITGIVGLVIGLFLGLVVLGWWLFPVHWVNGSPADLHETFQKDYLRSAIYSYATDKDKALAQQRWENLGTDADAILNELLMDQSINAQTIADYLTVIEESPAVVATPMPGETQPPIEQIITPEPEKKPVSTAVLLSLLCIVLLAIGGALVYVLFIRKRKMAAEEYEPPQRVERPMRQPAAAPARVTSQPAPVIQEPEEQDAPVAQFMTTYMLGDDLYDDSFSIDSPTGEFLGECGVGISETIGVGDPKKVTAFEVWLFDKNDIQTVTKVVMSEHAWNDVTISQRLATKGEPLLMDPGKHIVLETASLILEARVVDMAYGQGALPAHSFFERLTLELAVWQK